MKTKRRGGVKVFEGRVYARVRYGKDERLEQRLPWATPRDRAAALERATLIADLCDSLVVAGRRDLVKRMAREAANAATPKVLDTVRKSVAAFARAGASAKLPSQHFTTFRDVAEDWITGELHKKFRGRLRSKGDFHIEKGRLERYIYPHVGDVPIIAFTRDDADLVMANLPPSRVKADGTRRHIAQVVARVLNLAVVPLNLIERSPLPHGWLPMVESYRHYTCLYPTEEAKLLGCKDVDETLRLFFGILDREGMRVSELADCEWWQWNTDVGTFQATKTKGGDPRMWAARPDVARAMRIWKERHGKTKPKPFADLFEEKDAKLYFATKLRDALKLAGIDRHELFESTEYTGKMRTHDLRATFVTLSLAEGKTDTWIRDRTGHKTLSMIDRYRRTARQFDELKVGPLADLVDAMGWGIHRVILATGTDGEGDESPEDTDGSGAEIRTPIRGSKSHYEPSAPSRSPIVSDVSASDDEPPPPGITQGSPTLERLQGEAALLGVCFDVLDAYALKLANGGER